MPRTYRRDQRQGKEGKKNHSIKPPRPTVCDLPMCGVVILPEHELYYDSRFPMLVEIPRIDGTRYFQEKVPCFCSEDCRSTHRSRFFATRYRATHAPSP